jgi:hypothetical protein
MKKFLIAAAAATTLFAGASAANAGVKVHLDLGGYSPFYGHGYYEPITYTKCFYKKVKVVKWIYGEKHVFWKTKKVCKPVYYGY